ALPLGLEQAEVAALRQLLQSPPYLHYSAVLERVLCTQVDALLSALPHDRYLFQCGVVYATRRLIELPHDILAKVTELEAHANARDRAAANARDGIPLSRRRRDPDRKRFPVNARTRLRASDRPAAPANRRTSCLGRVRRGAVAAPKRVREVGARNPTRAREAPAAPLDT